MRHPRERHDSVEKGKRSGGPLTSFGGGPVPLLNVPHVSTLVVGSATRTAGGRARVRDLGLCDVYCSVQCPKEGVSGPNHLYRHPQFGPRPSTRPSLTLSHVSGGTGVGPPTVRSRSVAGEGRERARWDVWEVSECNDRARGTCVPPVTFPSRPLLQLRLGDPTREGWR